MRQQKGCCRTGKEAALPAKLTVPQAIVETTSLVVLRKARPTGVVFEPVTGERVAAAAEQPCAREHLELGRAQRPGVAAFKPQAR